MLTRSRENFKFISGMVCVDDRNHRFSFEFGWNNALSNCLFGGVEDKADNSIVKVVNWMNDFSRIYSSSSRMLNSFGSGSPIETV